jgi:hypothetical protein
MECPQCQHENPPQSKFCLDCGAPWPGCPSCGIELPAGAKFCNECGQPWRPLLLEGRALPPPSPTPRSTSPRNVAARFLQAPNPGGGPRISTADSPASVWMIPTNEEMMIASHTLACIRP